MEKTSKEMRQFRVESGISSNQLRAFVGTLLEKGIAVDSLKSKDLLGVSNIILDMWNVSVDSRHSDQMHRYLVFAISSTIPEESSDLEDPVLLPFSRQKVFISLPLAIHLVLINGKLPASLESNAAGLLQVVSARQLEVFVAAYLVALLPAGAVPEPSWCEVSALMLACPDGLLPAWLRLPPSTWRALIDRGAAEEEAGGLFPLLSLLLRLLSCELSEEVELPKGLPGIALLWRLYGPALLRPQEFSDKRYDAAAVGVLKSAWRHLLAQGRPARWAALLAARGANEAAALAARDLRLTLLMQAMPNAEAPLEAQLRRGTDSYLEMEYGTEDKVLSTHCGAIERRLTEEEDEGFVRWLVWDVNPHAILRSKSLTSALIEKIVPLASPKLFLHLLEAWPNGTLTTVALRRMLAALSPEQRVAVHVTLSSQSFSFPNGREAWHLELRSCLNRAAASDPEAASQELNLLALYDAAGVLHALMAAGMQHKGSFELVVALLQRASHLFLLPPCPPRPAPPAFLLGVALQGALARERSPEQRAAWRRLSDALCGLLPPAGPVRRLLLAELVLPGLRSKRCTAELLQLAGSLLQDADADIAPPDQLRAIFAFALTRICWQEAAEEAEKEEEEEEGEGDEEEAALALVSRLQSSPFLPALACPALGALLLRLPLPARLLGLEALRAAGQELQLPRRLGAMFDAAALREAGVALPKGAKAANAAVAAEAMALTASSPAALALLAPRLQLPKEWEDPAAELCSALLHAAHVMPRAAWGRLPAVLDAVLRSAADRAVYRPLSDARLPATDLTDAVQQLAALEVLGEASALLLQASFFREAARSLAASRFCLAGLARRLQASGDAPGAAFLRKEAIAWTRRLLDRCPPAWSQSAALGLVLQELEKAT